MSTQKPIRLSGHAREQLVRRGVEAIEVIETIQTSTWEPSELNRLQCRKDFPFGALWNEKPYKTKQVRPIFVEESAEIVVITVYSYYF
jgi:hypothetical protein